MRYRRTGFIAVLAMSCVVAFGLLGAFFMPTSGAGRNDERTSVHIPADQVGPGVFCHDEEHFCVTPESLQAGFAVATVNALSFTVLAQHAGCPARWLPDFDLSSVNGGPGRGAFRVPCDGQTFTALGERLFGPAPGDLARLPVSAEGDRYRVDLRQLRALEP
jgi:hypothetical protein